MKTLYIILAVAALGLIVFNATILDFSNLFEGDSLIALISIFASLCAFMLLAILFVSRKIKEKIGD
ncbi:MAG: hypothetical protein Q4G08_10075 [Capnocytophaga sp.]|nr:hypothetical protein [Capnocytophaga sp.]